MQIPSKSITVIEDIDCSLNLTGQRKKMKEKKAVEEEEKDPIKKKAKVGDSDEGKTSKVTLSGLLNFIDGLWSASKGERLIVFTTNHMEKLDPALIRRGRMDKHIELSYCSFESFKVLTKNYLELDSHYLFDTIERLLGESKVTPADVAEHLMRKNTSVADAETSLKSLVQALEMAKKEAMLKAKEEGKEKESSAREED
ncbi:AAA-ATPase [Vitis vinifera]|uniref:AAA-ATPase n=1 Tax=Vitis vinifera TaxID=29760 RepID=A0A438GUV9_VITVI|nr:AAA-ATPase [Vitis vinifera]